jgi:pimeloyl-ACP methyl ester carboxylesterase
VNITSTGKRALAAAGAAAGVALAGWAAPRIAAGRARRLPDADARRALEVPIYVDHRLDSHDHGSIYVVETGEATAPPIVLSHGVTLSVRTWFHQLELLPSDGFRAIAYDHRGHGDSVLGDAGHSLDALAEDVRTVLLALDLHDAILVGHSMGGVAVQSFVLQYPELARQRVRGIVLVSTLAKSPFGSRSTQMKARIERVFNRVPDSTVLWERKNLGFLAARIGFGKDPHPSHVELVRRMMHACASDTRRDAPRVLVGLDLTDKLPTVELPTLVVGGTADVLTPPAYAEQLARLIPDSRLALLEDGGHMLMLERTEELDRLIVDFAREVGAAP